MERVYSGGPNDVGRLFRVEAPPQESASNTVCRASGLATGRNAWRSGQVAGINPCRRMFCLLQGWFRLGRRARNHDHEFESSSTEDVRVGCQAPK
jgi:hypothetical protein